VWLEECGKTTAQLGKYQTFNNFIFKNFNLKFSKSHVYLTNVFVLGYVIYGMMPTNKKKIR